MPNVFNMPQRVKIGAINWHVEQASHDLQLEELRGHTLPALRTMRVDETMPLSLQQETLLHEVLHALSVPLDNDQQLTEQQVRHTAAYLMQIFTDNPRLREFLFQEEDDA